MQDETVKLKVRQLGIIQQTLFVKTPRESSAILEFVNVAISSAQGLQLHIVGVAPRINDTYLTQKFSND